jgi:hypothetical protein
MACCAQHRFDCLHPDRAREEVALRVRTAEPLELPRLALVLHTFRHHPGFQGARERDDALDDGRPLLEEKAADEGAVDLQRIHWQLVQVAQGRVPRAEVIEVNPHPELTQVVEHLRHELRRVD